MPVDTSRYPELADLQERLRSRGIGIDVVLSDSVIETVKNKVVQLLEGKRFQGFGKDAELEFFVMILVMRALGIRAAFNRFLEDERARLTNLLARETQENLLEIAKLLGLELEQANLKVHRKSLTVSLDFRIHFIQYLNAIKGLKDERLKLNRRVLNGGYVYLSKDELTNLLADLLAERARTIYDSIDESSIPKELREVAKGLKARKFPPCMEALMAKKELNDDEVANLTAFLLAVGFDRKDVEALLKEKGVDNAGEIVEAFTPKRRKAYVPESCESLKAKGICVADCKVKNPLQYYFGSLT
ncbi:MAG: hypothetical protein ACP5HQ_08175 [Thermoprotei archaeon]